MKKTILSLFLSLLAMNVATQVIHAQVTPITPGAKYTLLEPLPCFSGQNCDSSGQVTEVTLSDYLTYAFNLIIGLSAVAAVFMIVWGGFEYMGSASVQTKGDGITRVKNALFGLVLVLASYIILRTIDPRLVAIPSSLVPPIQLNNRNNGVSDFFNGLLDESGTYSTQGQLDAATQLKASNDQAETTVNNLQTQADAVSLELQKAQAAGNQAQVTALQAQFDDLNNQATTVAGNAAVNTSNFMMDTGRDQSFQRLASLEQNRTATNDNISQEVATELATIQSIQVENDAKLGTLGAYDAIIAVDEKSNQDKIGVELGGLQAKTDIAQTRGDLDIEVNTISAQINTVGDPAAKQQLQAQLTTLQTKVNSLPR